VIEGDHGSAYFHPDSPYARRAFGCLVDLQREMGVSALIGRELYPLVTGDGYRDVRVSARMVSADANRQDLVLGFTRLTFTAMIEGFGEGAVGKGVMSREDREQGMRDLSRTAEPAGVFCLHLFQGNGKKVDPAYRFFADGAMRYPPNAASRAPGKRSSSPTHRGRWDRRGRGCRNRLRHGSPG